MSKSILQIFYSRSVQKPAPKNTNYSRTQTILKIGHYAKAIAFAKSSLWVKNSNSKKHAINETILKVGHHGEAIAKSSLWVKNAKSSLWAQKLKFQKTCQNPFYKSFTVVLCKTPLQKTKYSRNETILIGHHAKAVAFAKSSLWVKNSNSKKHVKIHSTNHLQKKSLQKTLNIREMTPF